jgi:two-component system, OmpR family, response regulator
VLLVEDDEPLARDIEAELQDRGFAVSWAADGQTGLVRGTSGRFDVLVVDRMLPALDGLTLIERLRARGVRTPVLVLSALNAVDEKVKGLKAGGDDYLAKPFAIEELDARLRALIRRPLEARETVLTGGPVSMDLIAQTVHCAGRPVELLPKEFRLLEYFLRRQGQILTRSMLFEDVWQYQFTPQTGLIDVHIGKLRRKIDQPGQPSLIENVRGVGFVFRADA